MNKLDSCSAVWGFYGHKKINRLAVFTLPEGMFSFYKRHIEFITEHAVDPDKRRYAVEGEAPRHYIDIDHYHHDSLTPFQYMPRKWVDATIKFSEDTLQAYGIVPWHVNTMQHWLTKAFKEKDINKILKLSAEIGHYIGDASVPLHTTENYNGQLTNQKGIHGFWESRIPELFSEDYDFFVGQATYIEEPQNYIWEVVEQSHNAVDSVLGFESNLHNDYPSDRKYAFDNRGNRTIKTYSKEYSKEYQDMLDGMIERRMRSSITSVGSFWYTCWMNAGQPNLDKLEKKEMTEKEKKEQEELDKQYKNGKIKGREHQH
ncbi:zinc dependent phospholipase C family protein [bacterium]|nr:zinc dependent phospholipase C family protein [bacterium]